MKTIKYVFLFLYLTISNLSAMEVTKKELADREKEFIDDVKKRCSLIYINPMLQVYPLNGRYDHIYYISQTQSVHPVKSTMLGYHDAKINPSTESNLPNPQFWIERPNLRISDDINDTNDTYRPFHTYQSIHNTNLALQNSLKFDGINQQGISVACLIKPINNSTTFYVFPRMAKKRQHEY